MRTSRSWPELPEQLAELGPDEIVLQQLMYLTPVEIAAYRKFSVENSAATIPNWKRGGGRMMRPIWPC